MMLVPLARRVIRFAVVLASVLFLVAVLINLWLLFRPPEATFSVVAETERIVMRSNRPLPWRWTFENASLNYGDHQEAFSGSLQLGVPVEVAVERVGHGTLWIAVRHAMEGGKCEPGTLFGTDEEAKGRTPCEFDLLIDDIPGRAARGQTTVLALEGDISAGRPVGFQTHGTGTALLRSGRVTLREPTILLGEPYDARTKDLDAGDFFRVRRPSEQQPAMGFVVIDERPAMTAAFRVIGREGTIERPGGGESRIANGIFSRFANDEFLRALVAVIAAILGLVSLGSAIVGGLDQHDPPAVGTAPGHSRKASI